MLEESGELVAVEGCDVFGAFAKTSLHDADQLEAVKAVDLEGGEDRPRRSSRDECHSR